MFPSFQISAMEKVLVSNTSDSSDINGNMHLTIGIGFQ